MKYTAILILTLLSRVYASDNEEVYITTNGKPLQLQEIPLATSGINPENYLPSGPDPYAWTRKLLYYKDCDKGDVSHAKVTKILDTAEYYFLSPTFRQYDGYNLFQNVAKKYEGKERGFPWVKVPLMLSVALSFDKVLYVPTLVGIYIGSLYAVTANVRGDFKAGIDFLNPWFPDNANSGCITCDENWMTFPGNATDPNNIQIGNTTFYFITFDDEPVCHNILENAKYYVMQACQNATWNPKPEDQAFNAYKIQESNTFQVYQVSGSFGIPDNIMSYQCNLNNAMSAATSLSHYLFAGIMGGFAAGIGMLGRWGGGTMLR